MNRVMRLAARGDGVTEDGRHVPFGAPGDIVSEDGTLVPGPHRQVPPCRHFPECGGCRLQHVDDAAYVGYLVDRVSGALAAQGLTAEVRAPHLSPPNTRRRATMRGERRGRGVVLGFNEEKSTKIIDLQECHVILPELFALVAPLRTLLQTLLPDRGRATVAMTSADQGVDLLLAGVPTEDLAASERLQAFAAEHALARLSVDEGHGPELRWQPEAVTVTLGGVPVGLPEGAFLQATADGEAALIAAAREALGDRVRIVDLFAGLGTFALALEARYAIEGSRAAAAALLATRRCQVGHRDLFRRPMTAAELAPFDGVVLDPPRAGAIEQVHELAKAAAVRLAYVSCNPATFARDARVLLDGGWRLDWVRPVGQFRWSTHVELVGAFSRA